MRFLDVFSRTYDEVGGAKDAPGSTASPKRYKNLLKGAARIRSSAMSTLRKVDNIAGEGSPYDFERIIKAIDIDSYAKTAFAKYQELMWKEGYEIVSENTKALDYLSMRLEYMSLVMGRPIDNFFEEVTDALCKFHNVFVAKVRNPEFVKLFPGKISTSHPKGPVVGYEIIPTEEVRIVRDSRNRPIKYIQGVGGMFDGRKTAPSWSADEVIHLYRDKRSGKAFGTPFMTGAMDDIVSLRQMENDVQNMVHKELNPIIDVTVGNDAYPGDDDEVDRAVETIYSMANDGTIVHTERLSIDIKGSEGEALDASKYLTLMQGRVAVGLGLYPHHLGMMHGSGNRSMTEQLDTALYDRIKTYQRYFASMVVQQFINEILVEGGFNPYVPVANDGKSDKCIFRFKEIDQDTRVKKENHVIQKVVSNLMTIGEARSELGLDPEFDIDDTHAALTAKFAMAVIDRNNGAKRDSDGNVDLDKDGPPARGAPSRKNARKGPGNRNAPKNQHKRKLSPDIKHDDTIDTWLDIASNVLDLEEESDG